MVYLYVALGGAAGALARFAVGAWVGRLADPRFPWATLAINLSGSLLLGVLMGWLPEGEASQGARALLAVGFCGAFTTFSTFGYETWVLLQAERYAWAAAYVAASVLAGLLAVIAGMSLGARL